MIRFIINATKKLVGWNWESEFREEVRKNQEKLVKNIIKAYMARIDPYTFSISTTDVQNEEERKSKTCYQK